MKRIIVIYGPTATGKTALGIELVKKYHGELISADSRQVYKGLDIGTGKVSFGSRVEKHDGYWIVDGIRINGFDLREPNESFTVVDFIKFTNTSIIRIIKEGKLPIIVGGTGFYIKALIDGIDSIGIPTNQKLRQKLEKLSSQKLNQKLLTINPKRARSMNQSDRVNPRRLIRAIEIALYYKRQETGNLRQGTNNSNLPIYPSTQLPNYLLIGLTAPNDYLYKHADNWLQIRLDHGMIKEIEGLLDTGVDPAWLENLGLEYRWITKYVLGKMTMEESQERLHGDIHSFIRRQRSWFKKFENLNLFDISEKAWHQKLENKIKLSPEEAS